MEQVLAENLSKKLQININNIVREYWEMFILNELYASPLAQFLVFKGGTALRLIYKSPRFSEDLDFSVLDKIDFGQFKKVIEDIVSAQPELSLKEIYYKKYTCFVLIKFKQDYLNQALSIKIEISRRRILLKKDKDFELLIAASPASNLKPLVRVLVLERMYKDKINALSSRKKARDLFDVWFIAQLLKHEQVVFTKVEIKEKEIRQELHRLLPRNYYQVIPEIFKYVKNK